MHDRSFGTCGLHQYKNIISPKTDFIRKHYCPNTFHVTIKIQGVARLFADLNLAPSALRLWDWYHWKGTSRSFLSPWFSACLRWSKEERELAEEVYFSNGRTKAQKQWPVHNAETSHEVLLGCLHSNSAYFAYSRNRKCR